MTAARPWKLRAWRELIFIAATVPLADEPSVDFSLSG
jgi:hypothetical protein